MEEEHICWDCDNAFYSCKCNWIKNFELPKGVKLNAGNIVFCPNFKPDLMDKKTVKELAAEKGVSVRTYYRKYIGRENDDRRMPKKK